MSRSLLLIALTLASLGWAQSPAAEPDAAAAREVVEKGFIAPLRQKDASRSRFSRSPPPTARRVRITDEAVRTDAKGEHFYAFAIDSRFSYAKPGEWIADVATGCVYPDTKEIFVHTGPEFLPVGVFFGKRAKAVPSACIPGELSQR